MRATGWNARGGPTLVSLVLIGVLGAGFAAAARLTGAEEDTAGLAAALGTTVDGRGLVLAGLVIGALGALDDVTVTQTSAVWELRIANPQMRAAALFGAAMRIGREFGISPLRCPPLPDDQT